MFKKKSVYDEDTSHLQERYSLFCLFVSPRQPEHEKRMLLECVRLDVRANWGICAEHSLTFSLRLERLNVVLFAVAKTEKGSGLGLMVSWSLFVQAL